MLINLANMQEIENRSPSLAKELRFFMAEPKESNKNKNIFTKIYEAIIEGRSLRSKMMVHRLED